MDERDRTGMSLTDRTDIDSKSLEVPCGHLVVDAGNCMKHLRGGRRQHAQMALLFQTLNNQYLRSTPKAPLAEAAKPNDVQYLTYWRSK